MRLIWMLMLLGVAFTANGEMLTKKKTKDPQKIVKQVHTIIRKTIHTNVIVAKASSGGVYGTSQLNNELNRLINGGNYNAQVAVYVKSMKKGDNLYMRNIYRPLTPASTLKVLTAEASLLFLGPDYRYSTQLLTDAKKIKDGVLQGNLYIILNGDPTLTYNDLADLLVTLRTQQINAISGNVYIDSSAYDQRYYGPGWNEKDKSYCFAAPVGASIINHNCIAFTVTPALSAGSPAQIVTYPKYFYPSIRNGVITKANRSRGCSLRLATVPGNSLTVDGCMPKGKYAWGVNYVVADIPEYNRNLFKTLLNRLTISVYGLVTFGTAPKDARMISQHASKPLRLLITDMLKKSDNVIAGALFKKMGQLYTRRAGSWETGAIAVQKILSEQAKVDVTGLKVLDGSGLSPHNLLSSAQMMQVLDFAYHHYPTSYEFVSALPIAGVDGTLKNRMGNVARKVRAKTGTISGVVTLAGYAVTAEKEPVAFVIMVNGSKGLSWQYRALQDEIVSVLTRYRRIGE